MSEHECYVAFKSCGCAVAACVDNPEHSRDTARTVADYVRSGLRVERRTCEWVRSNMRACRCEVAPSAQEVLDLTAPAGGLTVEGP